MCGSVIPRKVQNAVFHPLRWASSTVHFEPASSGSVEPRALRLPQLLVADKTGDIHCLSGTDLHIHTLEMAHLANITGLAFYESPAHGAQAVQPANSAAAQQHQADRPRNYLLTSDSDGKIRVSNSPNFYDVQSYCLGHQASVKPDSTAQASGALLITLCSGHSQFIH